jgi:WD40 repeat protein
MPLLQEWSYPGQVTHIACSAAGKRVAFGGEGRSIECWERNGGEWQRLYIHLDAKAAELPPFALSPDGETLAVARFDRGEIQVYLVASGERLVSFPAPRGKVEVIAFSPQGELTVGGDTGWVHVWDASMPQFERSPFKASYKADITHQGGRAIKALAWSPDGEILTTSEEGDWYVCVYLYHESAWTRSLFHQDGLAVQALAWRPDSKRVAIACGSQVEIRARQSRTKPLVTCAGGHAALIAALAWSDDGERLLSLDQGGVLCAWDARTGSLVRRLDEEGGFCSLAVVKEGQLLVGRRNWTVQLYEALTVVGYRVSGEESRELTSPEEWSYAQCSGCLCGDDLREQQEENEVQSMYRLEAENLVCACCHIYLANGRPAPTGHPLRDCFRVDLDDLRAELDIDGWVYGGCWIAALGLLLWIQQSAPGTVAKLMVIEGTRENVGSPILDHVVVELLIGGSSYCMDPDGGSLQENFLWEWHIVHGLDGCHLVPLDEQRLRATDIPSCPEMSESVAATLLDTLGPWQRDQLELFARSNKR